MIVDAFLVVEWIGDNWEGHEKPIMVFDDRTMAEKFCDDANIQALLDKEIYQQWCNRLEKLKKKDIRSELDQHWDIEPDDGHGRWYVTIIDRTPK